MWMLKKNTPTWNPKIIRPKNANFKISENLKKFHSILLDCYNLKCGVTLHLKKCYLSDITLSENFNKLW